MKYKKKKIAIVDSETDPFKYGRDPWPFAWGFYDGDTYEEFWGDDSTERFLDFLSRLDDDYIIYAHNGGKFDFFFLLYMGMIENPVKIINGRITKARIGRHEIRDSYSILPVPLAAYRKVENFDYNKMERENREKHKAEILTYLYKDCLYLYEIVTRFIDRFGLHLTIGGLAIKTLRQFHPFEQTNGTHDERIRPFYFGGRVQFFESGKLTGKFRVYDVNSMYPHVMANCKHPAGEDNYISYYVDKNCRKLIDPKGYAKDNMPYFISFTGSNKGALPTRTKDGLTFDIEYGTFYATHHEIQVALKYGLITLDEIHELHLFDESICFDEFVETFSNEKIEAKQGKDKAGEIFAKLLLNSSYGKTAQNPENFKDYFIWYEGEQRPDIDEWELYLDAGDVEIWTRPAPAPIYYDVAIGASITGAARAVLLDALCQVKRPLYCDTDSIICEGPGDLPLDPYTLGYWDLEASGDTLHIAGKKLYSLFDGPACVKLASKGAKLSGTDIAKVARGGVVEWASDAPNFKLDGQTKYTKRTIKKRANF